MTTRFLSSLLIIFGCFSQSLTAQQTGRVDYPQLGLSFTIPNGWMGQEAEGLYLMGHNSIPGFLFLIPHDQSLTVAQMRTEAQAGLNLGGGTQLNPTGTLQTIGSDQVGGVFEGMVEYSPARAFILGKENPHGNGITVIAVTSPQAFDAASYRGFAESLANSVQFSEVPTNTAASAPQGAARGTLDDWQYQLSGTLLTFTESYYSGGDMGGGYNIDRKIHLCQAGYFLYYDQSLISAGNASANAYSSSQGRGHGNWEVTEQGGTFYLALNFNDGSQKQYQLSWGEDNKLFLNGERYYRTWSGEYAPNCE